MDKKPIVIDLDGTLIKGDMLWDALVDAIKLRPLTLPKAVFKLILHGKAKFKESVSADFEFDPADLPFRAEVMELIQSAKAEGRKIVLSTGSHMSVAKEIAAHLGVFDLVIGSSNSVNNSGTLKAKDLVDRFGTGGFDYVGDSVRDLPVWLHADLRYVVGHSRFHSRIGDAIVIPSTTNEPGQGLTSSMIKSSRPHQWAKNLLILVPAFASQQFLQGGVLFSVLLAFASFSAVSSSVYVLNDVLDLKEDRSHQSKRFRAIASGGISVPGALAFGLALLFFGLAISLTLGQEAMIGLVSYFILSLVYSTKLKQIAIVDVVTLAFLYTFRLVFGALVAKTDISIWLLGFSLFFFFSLALVKRHAEASALETHLRGKSILGRGYGARDVGMIANLGVAAGLGSVIVFALYLTSDSTLGIYRTPEVLWLAVPVLLAWTSWIWIKAARNEMLEDPILFALRDRFSMVCGFLTLMIFATAQILKI